MVTAAPATRGEDSQHLAVRGVIEGEGVVARPPYGAAAGDDGRPPWGVAGEG